MKRASRFICLLFFVAFAAISNAQTDTEFWFAAPDVSTASEMLLDRPIILVISTYDESATVTISQPAGGGMPDVTLSIPANSNITHNPTTYLANIEAGPADMVLDNGLHITSTAPVSIYYQVVTGVGSLDYMANPETFVLKGNNALGTEFVIPSQTMLFNGPDYSPLPYNSFVIVASEDNTNITVTPSKMILGHPAETPFSFVLDKGQVYSATAVSQSADGHLAGSMVSSDKPIAITVSDDLLRGDIFGGCADLGGDQIVPISILGKKYIGMNGMLNSPGDYIFLTAIADGTEIEKDGTLIATIDAGETYNLLVENPSTYIETSDLVSAWQLSGIGCEIGLAQLPPIECTGSSKVSYTRSIAELLYVNVFTEAGNESGFTVNGSATILPSSAFSPVPGTSDDWVAAKVELPLSAFPINENIVVENSIGRFHLGVMEGGYTTGAAFGYFSDFGTQSILNISAKTTCEGDTIKLFAGGTSEGYYWTGPDGFFSTEANPIITNASDIHVGMYYLTVSNSCGELKDSLFVGPIKPFPIVNAGNDTLICEGQLLHLSISEVADGHSITWQGPGGFSSTEKDVDVFFPLPGMYIVRVDNDGCAKSDTVNVEVVNNVEVDLGRDTIICIGKPLTLDASGSNGNYLWSNGSINSKLVVEETGKYWVEVTLPPSCKSSDTIDVEFVHCEACIPLVPSAFSPNNDGMNDIFRPVYKPYCFVYNYHMQIYSRWGQRLYNSFRIEDGWNGWVHDKTADLGVYMYYITYRESADGEEIVIKGDVTLLR